MKNSLYVAKTLEERQELRKKIDDFIQKTTKTFENEIYNRGCLGSIAELYDSNEPYLPKGTIAQAWSVAEVFRIILGR